MKISIGSDEKCHLTNHVVKLVKERGFDLTLFGALREEGQDWPEVAREVAEAVACGAADEGILFCWTGTGVSLAANKVPGIRAALCDDAETAKGARLWNNANLLCFSIRRMSDVIATEIIEAWFGTAYVPNEVDDRCLRQVETLEAVYRSKK
ncbi:MAG: ribose 5-phosphate isomerase B [Ardenticatenaceae bacterium]|nr:MAG: ribose 5-phosphate isomerase B [Ardenticatenaceae bacterium]